MRKNILKLFGLGAALALLAWAAGNSGQLGLAMADVTPGGMAYVWYDWPRPLPVYWNGTQIGFYNFDVLLTIDVDPGTSAYYYWAHQFHFNNGDGGYMGLQTNGSMQGRWVGKMAIFSIWQAKAAQPGPGAACERFTGEGEGWSCRMQYKWVQGHAYRLRLWELCCADKPQQDEWWGAWIMDTTTGQEVFLGQIQVPSSWQWLDWSVVWVEYYGSVSDCSAIPYAKARFERPTADNGTFRPQNLTTDYGRTCPNAKITPIGNQGAIFETGGNVRRG
jgi:hypothetical protein